MKKQKDVVKTGYVVWVDGDKQPQVVQYKYIDQPTCYRLVERVPAFGNWIQTTKGMHARWVPQETKADAIHEYIEKCLEDVVIAKDQYEKARTRFYQARISLERELQPKTKQLVWTLKLL